MSQKLSTREYKFLTEVINARIEGFQLAANMQANCGKDKEAGECLRQATDLRRILSKCDPMEVDL